MANRVNKTLKFDQEIYNKFSTLCEENGLIRSRVLERFMKEYIK